MEDSKALHRHSLVILFECLFVFDTPGMYRAHMDAEGNLNVKIYKK